MPNTLSTFSFPTRIVFGPGAIREVGSEARRLGIERPLLLTDLGIVECGLAERVVTQARSAGLAPRLFAEVNPNPVERNVLDGLESYR